MFLIIPIIGGLVAIAPMVVPAAGVVGGLIIAPTVLKASSNVVNLIKDGKIGLEAQAIIMRIGEYDEQIGNIVIENGLEFDNDMFTKEISLIKENMKKIETKRNELEKIKEDK